MNTYYKLGKLFVVNIKIFKKAIGSCVKNKNFNHILFK